MKTAYWTLKHEGGRHSRAKSLAYFLPRSMVLVSLLRSLFLGCHATLPPKKRLLTTEQHSFHDISQSQSRFHFQEPVRAKFVR